MVLAFGLCALVAYAIAGMPLAIAGRFRPVPVTVGTVVVLVGLSAVWRRRQPTGSSTGAGGSPWPARIAVGIAVMSALVNMAFSSEHLLGDRDPGAYVSTARWLANEGELVINARTEPFGSEPSLTYAEYAFTENDRKDEPGKLYPQSLHLLPLVLAGAMQAGGTALALKLPALLGASSLLIFFVLARRLVRPWLALAAMAALSMNLVQVYVSRDAFSEVLMQPLILGGLWMLWDARDRLDPSRALISGLLFGAVCMARLDGLLILAPLSAYGFVEAVRLRGQVRHGDNRPQRGMFLLALGVGAVVTTNLALADLVLRSPAYISNFGKELAITAGVVGSVWLFGPAALLLAWRWGGMRSFVMHHRRAIGAIAATGALTLAGFAVFVRPQLPQFEAHGNAVSYIAGLQNLQGLPVDATRTYDEESILWLAWYLGPLVLAAAILGWAFQLRRAVLGRVTRQLPFLLCFSTITVAYLWKHGASPDQVWAARRFLPLTLPGVILLAILLVEHVLRAGGSRPSPPRQWFAGVFAVVMVGWPLVTLTPVAAARTQSGMVEAVERVCDAMTPDAAVVILPGRSLEHVFAQTLRSFCRVPVAIAPLHAEPRTLTRLALAWKGEGRTLHVITADRAALDPISGAGIVAEIRVTSSRTLEQTIERRPRALTRADFQMFVAVLSTVPS